MKRIVSVFMAALMAALMFCFTVVPVSAAVSYPDPHPDKFNLDDNFIKVYNDFNFNDYKEFWDDFYSLAVSNSFFPSFSVPLFAYSRGNDYIVYYIRCYDSNSFPVVSLNFNNNLSVKVNGGSSFWYCIYNVQGQRSVYSFNEWAAIYTFNYDNYIFFPFLSCDFSDPLPEFDYDNNYSGLGIDVDDFFNWYNSTNDKYNNQLASNRVPSFNIDDTNLKYLLDYFNNYGNKFDLFYVARDKISLCYRYPDRPPSEAEFHLLFELLHDHYLDYKRYKSMFLPDVVPNVSVDDTLITDIDVDTIDISLLRDILRTLIIIYNSVNDVDLNLLSYILNMYLKIDSLISDIDANFTALRSDLSLHFDSLADKIGISVANNLSPSLSSIDNSVNALAVPLTDIDANLEANLQAVNNIDGSVNNLDVSLKEINNSVSGGSGGCCSGSGSGSSVEAPEVPDFDFDTLKDGMGNFLDFFVWVCDHLPPSITVLMGAALSVAIYCRICAR